ncbi:bifunctional glutamate N-acetyltransferase/amino-acid acetyltransferase ArgJ [Rhodovulum sp. DZ06]|uniref:bifunctional glutamate N-acetyltransferase/amino-acid acetyltransferase ArgJ n=1 Tax=Rhodovulum sp. DZ06 TaxID=3425126 RepID=UPI003D3536CF
MSKHDKPKSHKDEKKKTRKKTDEAVLAALRGIESRLAALEAAAAPAAAAPKKKGLAVSPLAPESFPELPVIDGVRFAAAEAGVRYKNRLDVMLAELAPGSVVAGVFTKSSTRSAPVLWCEARRAGPGTDQAQAILVNAGNSNAFTGRNGWEAVEFCAYSCGQALGIPADNVWIASTGVIGEPLPTDRIYEKLGELAAGLAPERAREAAEAIRTTDTFAKGACAEVDLDGVTVKVSGFAKGSGMIAPDMATMLGFVFTDAHIDRAALQAMLSASAETTFNSTTVDGDTSTSDSVLLAATGKAPMSQIVDASDPRWAALKGAVDAVLMDLALQIVRDGEGATKLVHVHVTGAESDAAAKTIGLSIANSPLVKTAVAGEDPNWGRIVMAVGKSGEAADRDNLLIRFGEIVVAESGWVSPGYKEADGAAYMKQPELDIHVDVGVGEGSAVVHTCDLTHGYISINADYRS